MNNGNSAEAVAEALRSECESLPAGARLPSNRQLVARFSVSASTVSAALALLARRGVIETRPGIGAFTSTSRPITESRDTRWQKAALDLGPSASSETPLGLRTFDATPLRATLREQHPDVIDLNSGYLHPDLQPLAVLQRAFTRAAKNAAAWHRPALAGVPELRSWFAQDIGGDLGREDVVISPGGQAALATILRSLTQPGDPVIVEAPTYPGTLAAASAAGLRTVPVTVDAEGLDVELLDAALEQSHARVVVVQPLFQNPTGASLSTERRRHLLQVAQAHQAFVVEDDFARYLRHADAPRPPSPLVVDDPYGTVIHIRSLTKVASPNVRIAAVVSRGTVSIRLRDAFTIENMLVPAPLQFVALEAVQQAGWRHHQTRLAEELTARRVSAASAVREHLGTDALPLEPRGGYQLWLRLPPEADPHDVADNALRLGVAVTPGSTYTGATAESPHLRLSYVATPSSADLVDGIRRLGKALETR